MRSAVVARRRAALRTALVLHGPLLAVTTREVLGLCRAVRPTLALALALALTLALTRALTLAWCWHEPIQAMWQMSSCSSGSPRAAR